MASQHPKLRSFVKSTISKLAFGSRQKMDSQAFDTGLALEQLEPRMMLSGNVQATLDGGDLFITGDSLDNDIEVALVDGNIVLTGIDDTTINGATSDFVVASNSVSFDGAVRVELDSGNDRFVIRDGMSFGDRVRIRAGAGNDLLGIGASTFTERMRISTSDGNDSLAFNDSILDDVFIATGDNDDTLSFVDSTINGMLIVVTGRGADNFVLDTTSVQGSVKAYMGSGNDNAVVSDSNIGRNLKIKTRSGDDFVQVDSTTVGRTSVINLGTGDDAAEMIGDNQIGQANLVLGGSGNNQGNISAATTSRANVAGGLDSNVVDSTLVESRLNDATNGALTLSTAAQQVFGETDDPDDPDDPTDPENADLTVDFSQDVVNEVSDLLVVRDTQMDLSGTATPGTEIDIDVDNDGEFDDGSVTVGDDGSFEIIAAITDELDITTVNVQATSPDGIVENESADVFLAVDRTITYQTTLGEINVELLAEDAPLTVRNFLNYFERDEPIIVHRSPSNFGIVQSGSFTFEDGGVQSVLADAAIPNEFDPDNSNVRGTISMALLSNQPASGTSGWFFNVDDNTGLDSDLHTVFGRVDDAGLDVLDAIAAVPDFDLRTLLSNSALQNLPLRDYADSGAAPTIDNFIFINGGPEDPVVDPLTLTVATTPNEVTESNGTQLTTIQNLQLIGTTTPGATVLVDSDGDGEFDDGTANVAADGSYVVTVSLTHDDTNLGANTIVVQATDSTGAELTETLDVHYAVGTVYRIATSLDGVTFDIELFDTDAPQSVAKFNSLTSVYEGTFVDSSLVIGTESDVSTISAGGYEFANETLTAVELGETVDNEFDANNSNVRGTLAMSRASIDDLDSANGRWFINLSDENATTLDAQSFTVFGRVIGTGIEQADQIFNNATFDLTSLFTTDDLTNVPLVDYDGVTVPRPGTVSIVEDSNQLTGIGTDFTQSLAPGDVIEIAGVEYTIESIASDTVAVLTTNAVATATDQVIEEDNAPVESNFITLESIEELFSNN